MVMYKVTNKMKDVRQFRDNYVGKDVFVEPGKFVLTNRPPQENVVWKVELVEKFEKKKIKEKKMEVDKL
jgi:hypothetical protein